jgi:hypothetical protein
VHDAAGDFVVFQAHFECCLGSLESQATVSPDTQVLPERIPTIAVDVSLHCFGCNEAACG